MVEVVKVRHLGREVGWQGEHCQREGSGAKVGLGGGLSR